MTMYLRHYRTLAAVIIIGVLLFGWQISRWSTSAHQQRAQQSLQTLLTTTHHAVSSWARIQQQTARLWAQNADIRRLTRSLLKGPAIAEVLSDHQAHAELRRLLQTVIQENNYQGYVILNPSFRALSASQDELIGEHNALFDQLDLLRKILKGETLLSLPVRTRHSSDQSAAAIMFAAAPIYQDGRVMAILAFAIDAHEDFTELLQRGRLGNSGETYAFNREGILISNSRFDPQLRRAGLLKPGQPSILNIKIEDPGVNLLHDKLDTPPDVLPLTRMASSAVSGQGGVDVTGYRDYRGAEVIGAWAWDNTLDLGIATEMDTTEAYRLLHHDYILVTLIGILLIAMSTGLLMIFGRRQKNLEQMVRERTQALHNMTEYNHALLDSVKEGVYGVDNEGNITFINPAAANMVGYSAGELLGESIHEMIHHSYEDGSYYPRERCPVYDAYSNGNTHTVTSEVIWHKQGRPIAVEFTAQPIYRDGLLIGAVVNFLESDRRPDSNAS